MSTALINQPTTTLPGWLSGISGALPEALAAAKTVMEAGFAPKDCKGPQSIVVAAAMGARLGLDFFSSIYGIAVINNRPSLYGDAMLAVCQNNAAWEDFKEEWSGVKYNDDFTAKCSVKRKGREWKSFEFCVKDAKHAGLWEKAGPWKNTPQRMLMMRARAFVLRDVFADALAGFHSREEMEDGQLVDVTGTATVHDDPKPGKARTTKADKEPAAKDATPTTTAAEEKPKDANPANEGPAADKQEEPPKPLTSLQKAEAIDPASVTVDLIWKRCTILSTLKEPKQAGACLLQIIKEHNAAWKIATVSDLGGEADAERKRYLVELETKVAAWSVQFAKGIEL